MFRPNRILVPTDFSPCADQAFGHALALARRYGAELCVLNVSVVPQLPASSPGFPLVDQGGLRDALRRAAQERLEALCAQYRCQGIRLTEQLVEGFSVSATIVNHARQNRIDLIVMATHGRHALGHFLLGSVAERVVRLAPCSVMTVRGQEQPDETAGRLGCILVPIDFSKPARAALEQAREIAREAGARLELLHVIDDTLIHASVYVSGSLSINDLIPGIEPAARDELVAFDRATPGPEVAADHHVIQGRPDREIVRFAVAHGADLIVMSTHGLTGIGHLLLGSVVEQVIRYSPIPVLTIRTALEPAPETEELANAAEQDG